MHSRTSLAVSVLIACGLTLSACAGSDREPVRPTEIGPDGPEDRVAIGCALVRGGLDGDVSTRHYSEMAADALFRGALEADSDRAIAARLSDAADRLSEDESKAPRTTLLRICTAAGFDETAGLQEMRESACELSAALEAERPDIQAFGPDSTKSAPGDPRRTDVQFLDAAYILLAKKETSDWLNAESVGVALAGGDDEEYRASLDHFQEMCSRETSVTE